jgi:GNAT superfamily N-acetyltransferase
VRLAGRDDVAAIACLRTLWGAAELEPGFEERLGEWLASEGDRRTVWLVGLSGEPTGMASVLEYRRVPWPGRPTDPGDIGSMFVREEWRGRRIGEAILRAVIEAAESRDYARLVVRPSADAMPFYRRAGFGAADGTAGEALFVRPVRPR